MSAEAIQALSQTLIEVGGGAGGRPPIPDAANAADVTKLSDALSQGQGGQGGGAGPENAAQVSLGPEVKASAQQGNPGDQMLQGMEQMRPAAEPVGGVGKADGGLVENGLSQLGQMHDSYQANLNRLHEVSGKGDVSFGEILEVSQNLSQAGVMVDMVSQATKKVGDGVQTLMKGN